MFRILAIAFVVMGLGLNQAQAAQPLAIKGNLQQLIVGGVEANEHEFPFIVSLQKPSHFCGGSLIQKNWVLTAAHCMSNTSSMKVVIGLHSQKDPSKAETMKIAKVIIHPQYSSSRNDYDFALVQLAENSSYQPVRLNESEIAISDTDQTMSTTAGWGVTKDGGSTLSDKLQKVDIPLVSAKTCDAAYKGEITDRMICAGLKQGGKDSCQGDSGGPLLVRDNAGNSILVGVVSWGAGCAVANKYGVYSKVNSVVDWINEQTQ